MGWILFRSNIFNRIGISYHFQLDSALGLPRKKNRRVTQFYNNFNSPVTFLFSSRLLGEMDLIKDFQTRVLPIKDKLYRFALRIVEDDSEAKDVVQEVFIKVWHKREEMHLYKNMEAWCMRLTRNLSIDKLRSKHRRVVPLENGVAVPQTDTTPYQETAAKDTVDYVRKLMQGLPLKQKMVMQLRDIEGLTYQEVSQVLDIPLNQVKVNLFRARKTIRKQLIQSESYGL